MFKKSSVVLVFLYCLQCAYAQDSRIIFLENTQIYELIDRLQSRGFLLGLSPENLPYHYQEVLEEVDTVEERALSSLSKVWLNQLKDALSPSRKIDENSTIIHIGAEGGVQLNNTERRDVYRPSLNNVYVWPFLELNPTLQRNGIVLNANVKFDYYYDRDPDGIDAVNRWYTRNDKGYIGYTSDFIDAFVGRYSNHWGKMGYGAAMISSNPRTYDRVDIRLKTKYFRFSTLFGFLDDLGEDGIFDGSSRDDLEARRRFISAKRVDWRPNKDVIISYRESILYSGYRAIPEVKYFLTVNSATFLADNAPQNDVINLLFGLSIWKRINRLTLKGELIFDDIIFNRVDRGITERGTFSWIFNSTYAFKDQPLNIHFNNEVISYQSYNTDQAEGRYLYLGKGLATPFNDYVFSDVKLDWFLDEKIAGLRLSPYYGLLKQGEQEIDQPFTSSYPNGGAFEYVLTGTVETTHRIGINLFYAPQQAWWIKLDVGYNSVLNKNNISGVSSNRFLGMIEAGFRYTFSFKE